MRILAIDTSCDETSVAVTEGRLTLVNLIYSQVLLHRQWGGVVPSIAKRAHEEKISLLIQQAVDRIKSWSRIDYIAVTQGPGLAVALEVGINKAKELSEKYRRKIIAVNHMEGHIYSSFVQNSRGIPEKEFEFPYLALLVSGGHTELVIFRDHLKYDLLGRTIDGAAGEALDKAAKMLGLGYPGGPVIERLSVEIDNLDNYKFPRPMIKSPDLNFSFSGLKTSFYYYLKKISQVEKNKNIKFLASSFQEAVFQTLLKKTDKAISETGINRLVLGGGVVANLRLRKLFRSLVKKHQGRVMFPPVKYLTGDNAVMIGLAAFYKAKRGLFVKNNSELDRIPRLTFS